MIILKKKKNHIKRACITTHGIKSKQESVGYFLSLTAQVVNMYIVSTTNSGSASVLTAKAQRGERKKFF